MHSIQANSAGSKSTPVDVDAPPVLASGVSMAMATAGNDYTATVSEGDWIASANGGFVLLSLTGVTSTAANIEYCIGDGQTILIHVPYGYTTLYGESDANTTTVYLRKLDVTS